MLSSLPVEIWQEIFDQLILILGPEHQGFRIALRLRFVCSLYPIRLLVATSTNHRPVLGFFSHEIIRAIHATQILASDETLEASERLTSDFLRLQVLRNVESSLYLVNTIRATVRALLLSKDGTVFDTDLHNYYTTILSEVPVKLFPTAFILDALGANIYVKYLLWETDAPDSPRHLLSAAACFGNTALVEKLLLQGVSCNIGSSIFGPPLHLAVCYGHTDTAKLLLEAGADPNITLWDSQKSEYNNNRYRQLHYDEEESVNIYSITPLQIACCAGKWEAVRLLLLPEHGVPRTGLHYRLAILSAIKGNHLNIVNYLVNIGDLNSMPADLLECFWYRALRVACDHGAEDAVRMILDKGVPVDSPGSSMLESPLSLAAGHGFEEIVRLLLETGADPNRIIKTADDHIFYTPIKKAAHFGHLKSMQLMLDSSVSETPKGVTRSAAVGGQEHIIRYLAEKGLLQTLYQGRSMPDVTKMMIQCAHLRGYEWIESVLKDLGVLKP
ncbi:hypothetical protein PRK78_005740 [Emydomyces testavorans]|uniref:Ankyrin n=1 Tax=Emydomyces testavorans TaxID=2070801 RepID=A0AAF0DK73_9EURO|nr:hypothetical protein PRK78_005740 [Emydomyces testavorans]